MPEKSKVTIEDMQLDSGFLDDVDAVVSGAYFGENPEYSKQAGKKVLVLFLPLEGEDVPSDAKAPFYSIGDRTWKAVRTGAEILSTDKPTVHYFRANSNGGKLVRAMWELVGKGDIEAGQKWFVERGFYMTEGAFYDNLIFHWKRIPLETVGEKKDGKKESEVLMPVAFLGLRETVTVKATPAVAAAAPSTAPVGSDDLDAILISLVKGGDTDITIKQKAVRTPALLKNSDWVHSLVNGKHLEELVAAGKLFKNPADGTYIA